MIKIEFAIFWHKNRDQARWGWEATAVLQLFLVFRLKLIEQKVEIKQNLNF